MKKLPPLACALCLFIPGALCAANPLKPPARSVSSSGQFVIYCDDTTMRLAVSSFCEDAKSGIQDFLGLTELTQRERWKIPIVIYLFRPDAALPGQQHIGIVPRNVEGGGRRIELNVMLSGNLADIHFQQQVVHVILLEMEYRDKPAWKETDPIIDPPQWLVEGFCTYLKSRHADLDTDVYQTLLTNSDMPSLKDFLNETTAGMNASTLKLYQAYAYSFLQLLEGLPEGQNALGLYINDLPLGKDAPLQDLLKHFPSLGGSPESLEKWWTLSMARLAASDRYRGLSLDETEQRLTELLKFNIPVDKSGKTREYAIGDFKEFAKNPQAKPVLAEAGAGLQFFSMQANPLYRPVVAEYMVIIQELQGGKTRHTGEELKEVANYRAMVLKRMDQIADYLNWYEATQISKRSTSFYDYLNDAKQFSTDTSKRNDAISRYLDRLEIEMQ